MDQDKQREVNAKLHQSLVDLDVIGVCAAVDAGADVNALMQLDANTARRVGFTLCRPLTLVTVDPSIPEDGETVTEYHSILLVTPNMIGALIKGGADPNFLGNNGRLPLVDVAVAGHYIAVDTLLQGGAFRTECDGVGRTALRAVEEVLDDTTVPRPKRLRLVKTVARLRL